MARLKEYQRTIAYRIYVTDCVNNINQQKYMQARFCDLLYPKKEDTRTGDEIAEDIITKLNLSFEERGN